MNRLHQLLSLYQNAQMLNLLLLSSVQSVACALTNEFSYLCAPYWQQGATILVMLLWGIIITMAPHELPRYFKHRLTNRLFEGVSLALFILAAWLPAWSYEHLSPQEQTAWSTGTTALGFCLFCLIGLLVPTDEVPPGTSEYD